MSLAKRLKKKAIGLSQQAMARLFADEARAQKIAEAIGAGQRGKESIDKTQRLVMNQFNFATQADFKDLGKSLSALKRRMRSLEEKLGALQR